MMTDKERFKEYTFQIDWLRPLGKGHQLEIGAKYINRDNKSDAIQEFLGINSIVTDEFQHITNVWQVMPTINIKRTNGRLVQDYAMNTAT